MGYGRGPGEARPHGHTGFRFAVPLSSALFGSIRARRTTAQEHLSDSPRNRPPVPPGRLPRAVRGSRVPTEPTAPAGRSGYTGRSGYSTSRSPAATSAVSVLPGGGNGQMNASAKAQGGSTARLKSTVTRPSGAGGGVWRKRKR